MRRAALVARLGLCLAAPVLLAPPAAAADLGLEQPAREFPARELPNEGVPCGAPIVQRFPAVWQGRFQGGYAHYVGEGGPVVLDWRQERLCFPDRGSCTRYVADMRRDFHRPDGYFTCLPIR